jgi:uncharacterized cupin superfamily protein
MAEATPTPLVTTPCKVVDTAKLTISEYFGHVASKDGTCSFAVVEVSAADNAAFQTPAFAEYVICNEGIIELEHSDGEVIRVEPGQGAFLPSKLRLRWRFPGPCNYTVVCKPAFSPELAAHEESSGGTIVSAEARERLKAMHQEAGSAPTEGGVAAAAEGSAAALRATLVAPVNVVEAPGITIVEHFGHVSSRDGTASLGVATVKEASEEAWPNPNPNPNPNPTPINPNPNPNPTHNPNQAWQCPQFDEFVICAKGSIDFVYAGEGGAPTKVRVDAGQGVFLPKGLRVKWVWLEACRYYVLCLPAFSPDLCGREAEEGATVAKDSASMQRLEQMHAQTK